MPSSCKQDAGRVIRPEIRTDPSGRSCRSPGASGSMSLYRAGLELASFLPLGVAISPRDENRVRRCEPRCHSALSGRGDLLR